MIFKSHLTRAIPCPNCGVGLNGHTGTLDDEPPKNLDISLCAYCSAVLEFRINNGKPSFKHLTADEIVDLPVETRSNLRHTDEILKKMRRDGKIPPAKEF